MYNKTGVNVGSNESKQIGTDRTKKKTKNKLLFIWKSRFDLRISNRFRKIGEVRLE